MRCTRCDRPAIPQAVGRAPGGGVVFGWCRACLAETGCILVEETEISFGKTPRRKARRRRPDLASHPAEARRRLAYFVVGGMAAWTLTLTVLGLVSLCAPVDGGKGLGSRGTGQLLIVGGLMVGVTGLAIWAATLDRRFARQLGPKAVQTSSALLAFLTLAWGIARHDPRRDPWIVGTVAAALGISWLARRADRRVKAMSVVEPRAIERI